MSGGKKKSGFQITSVTSDYQASPKEPPRPGEARGPAGPDPGEAGAAGDARRAQEDAAVAPRNGPSAPGSPGAPPSVPGPGGAAGSRFRVVKLAQGSGEPYKRGRWTCRDFYEQEAEAPVAARLADPARHPQSLDSRLEAAGLPPKPPSLYSPQPQRRGGYLASQLALPAPGPSGHQARSLGGGLPLLGHPSRTPLPSPGAALRSPLAVLEPRLPASGDSAKEAGDWSPPGTVPALVVEEHSLPKSVAAHLIHREAEERCKVLPRESRSRPSSPAPPLLRDASPGRRTSDPFCAARFSLARSMFGMGVAHDSENDRWWWGESLADHQQWNASFLDVIRVHEVQNTLCPKKALAELEGSL
uniref:Uncharacterized protein n=1 Tax=Sphaerodactylus townsendi TaxID=933632 RepID=A0ACB8EWS2_9SAUR